MRAARHSVMAFKLLRLVFQLGKSLASTPTSPDTRTEPLWYRLYVLVVFSGITYGLVMTIINNDFYQKDIPMKIAVAYLTELNLYVFSFYTMIVLTFWKRPLWYHLFNLLRIVKNRTNSQKSKTRRLYTTFLLTLIFYVVADSYDNYRWFVHFGWDYFKKFNVRLVQLFLQLFHKLILLEILRMLKSRYQNLNQELKTQKRVSLTLVRRTTKTVCLLRRTVDIFNELFGFPVALIISFTTFELLNYLLFALYYEGNVSVSENVVLAVLRLHPTIVWTTLLVLAMDGVVQEAKRVETGINRLRFQDEELWEMGEYVHANRPVFSAAGFFHVSRPTILQMSASVANFLIVVVQVTVIIMQMVPVLMSYCSELIRSLVFVLAVIKAPTMDLSVIKLVFRIGGWFGVTPPRASAKPKLARKIFGVGVFLARLAVECFEFWQLCANLHLARVHFILKALMWAATALFNAYILVVIPCCRENAWFTIVNGLKTVCAKPTKYFSTFLTHHAIFAALALATSYVWVPQFDIWFLEYYVFDMIEMYNKFFCNLAAYILLKMILSRYKHQRVLLDAETMTKRKHQARILVTKISHNVLVLKHTVNVFNDTFGWIFLLNMFWLFVQTLFYLDMMIKGYSIQRGFGDDGKIVTIVQLTVCLVLFWVCILAPVLLCDDITNEHEELVSWCHYLQTCVGDKVDDNVSKLIEVLGKNRPEFSAAQYFSLDRSLVFSIFNTTATFLLVIIQLKTV